MSLLKSVTVSILAKTSGNRFAQNLLQKNVFISQYLMGIGSGTEVATSGESEIFRILKQSHKAPYCIFDVGANKGQFLSIALQSILTENFSIHCFEPSLHTFNLLAKHTIKDDRIKLNNLGLGRDKCQMTLYYNDAGSGLAS